MAERQLEPINLTVSRVNTSRNNARDGFRQSAAPGAESGSRRAADLPWSPETGKGFLLNSPLPMLGSPGLLGTGSLPLFQPSPRRTPLYGQSPTAQHFSLSALEAMLNSPVCRGGTVDMMMGSSHDSAYRLDTPNSRSALLDSIFASTPSRKGSTGVQPLMHSSDTKQSQRGFVEFTKIQQALVDQRQQPNVPDEKLKEHGADVSHEAPRQVPLESPLARVFNQHKGAEPSVSPNSLYMLNHFCGGLDVDAPLTQLFQQQLQQQQQQLVNGRIPPPGSRALPPAEEKLGSDLLGIGAAGTVPEVGNAANFRDELMGAETADVNSESELSQDSAIPSNQENLDSGGSKEPAMTRTCHCKKSQCLKLYCDCFAAGLFCANCACTSCLNRPEHGNQVMEKRENIMTRDPEAFSNKIQALGAKGKHKKGCNCKRSHCLKKYCECFQGGVKCGPVCKCQDCKNLEDAPGRGGRGAGAKAVSRKSSVAELATKSSGEELHAWGSGQHISADHARRDVKRFKFGMGETDPGEQTIAYGTGAAAAQGTSSPFAPPQMPTPNTVSSKHLHQENEHTRLDAQLSMLDTAGAPLELGLQRSGSAPAPGGFHLPRGSPESGANGMVLLQQQRVTPVKRKALGALDTPEKSLPFRLRGGGSEPSPSGLPLDALKLGSGPPSLPPMNSALKILQQQQSKQDAYDYMRRAASRQPHHSQQHSGNPTPGMPSPGALTPSQLLGGRHLTVKAPTPKLGGQNAAAAALAHIYSAGPNSLVTPTTGKCGTPSSQAVLMSPTASFDPMQMLASPMCADAPQSMYSQPSPKKAGALIRIGPGITRIVPRNP